MSATNETGRSRRFGRRDVLLSLAIGGAVAIYAGERWASPVRQSPSLDDAIQNAVADSYEVIWPESTSERVGAWTPISLRFIAFSTSLLVCGEFRSTHESWVAAPQMVAELYDGNDWIGSLAMPSMNDWVGPGASGFFQVIVESLETWDIRVFDRFRLSTVKQPIIRSDPSTFQALTMDGATVTNTIASPVGRVTVATIARDGNGIFAGACLIFSREVTIPAGASVRIAGLDELCESTSEGLAAASSLGHTAEPTRESMIARVEDPVSG